MIKLIHSSDPLFKITSSCHQQQLAVTRMTELAGMSKHLKNILRGGNIDMSNVDDSLNDRAVRNMNNYIRLINYRLNFDHKDADEKQNSDVSELLNFIHRHVGNRSHNGSCFET